MCVKQGVSLHFYRKQAEKTAAKCFFLKRCINLYRVRGVQTFFTEGHIADIIKTRGPEFTQVGGNQRSATLQNALSCPKIR